MTTQNLLTEWLEIYQKEHVKARTYSRYQGLITMHIVPMLGDKNIDELGRREIQEFLTQQKKTEIYETAKSSLPQVRI